MPTTGTAYEDTDTINMYESYQGKNEVYYVIEIGGFILGGGGVKALQNKTEICELQKMYFSPKIRGKDYGRVMFQKGMDAARKFGFNTCYLESDPKLAVAVSMYEKYGFKHLKEPLGDTGHNSCGTWMIKQL